MSKENGQNLLADDLYDIIRACALPVRQDDDWADLVKKHDKDTRKRLRKYLRNKELSICFNQIKIGERITITIH